MWLFDFMQKNRMLICSTYMIFFVLGLLTTYRILQGYSHQQLMPYFMYIGSALFIAVMTLFISQRSKYFYLQLCSILSVMVITSIYVEFSSFRLDIHEFALANIYLLAIASGMIIFLFERTSAIVIGVGKTVLYSGLFFIVLLVSKLVKPDLPFLLPYLVFGQVITYLVTVFFLSFLQIQPSSLESNAKQLKDRKQQSDALWGILFILLVASSLYVVLSQWQDFSWIILWVLSLFLLSGIVNSLKRSLLVHLILLTLFSGVLLTSVLTFAFQQNLDWMQELRSHELGKGLFFVWVLGLLPFHVAIISRHPVKGPYLWSGFAFLAVLGLVVLGFGFDQDDRWLTIFMLIGYIVVNVSGLLFYPILMRWIFVPNKRAHRSYAIATIENANRSEEGEVGSLQTMDNELREIKLAYLYRDWLNKKEQMLKEEEQKNR